jgi:predicted nucleic acid-binding protein
MEKKYLIDGPSFIKIFMIKPDSALDFIENSCIIEPCYSEVGDLISNRCSMEETEVEKARITARGEDLIDILRSVESIQVPWSDFKTMLNIAIYKKLNFREVSYLWAAKENKLILLTDSENLSRTAGELDIVSRSVEDI